MSEKAIYTLAFTILISAIIFSGSLVFSASLIASSTGFNNMDTITGNVVAPSGDTDTESEPTPDANPGPTPEPTTQVSVGNLPFKGEADAPITIIEFSEYQCPYCKRYVDQTYNQIIEQYVETGIVKYYFRDFPLSFHSNAEPAAIAARCANEQGKYWEYHDILFENQDSLGTENYKQWAADLGLDTEQFNTCVDEQKFKNDVNADFAAGAQAGVQGTPTFFINGNKLVGAQPFEVFKAAIESEL